MYTLFVSKKERVIEVKKAKKILQDLQYTDEVSRFNDCYWLCAKRKPLIAKANEIKQQWISELEVELSLINSISIVNFVFHKL